jgi:hypothetical protein
MRTLIADASSDSVFVAAGGALFPFIDPADITAATATSKVDPARIDGPVGYLEPSFHDT